MQPNAFFLYWGIKVTLGYKSNFLPLSPVLPLCMILIDCSGFEFCLKHLSSSLSLSLTCSAVCHIRSACVK